MAGLGFEVKSLPGEETIRAKVPSWRSDIYLPVDIAEEVGRRHGYDKIISRLSQFSFDPGNQNSSTLKEEKLRRHLVDKGLKEIVSFPLISPGLVELWGRRRAGRYKESPFSRAILSPSLSPFVCAGGSKN